MTLETHRKTALNHPISKCTFRLPSHLLYFLNFNDFSMCLCAFCRSPYMFKELCLNYNRLDWGRNGADNFQERFSRGKSLVILTCYFCSLQSIHPNNNKHFWLARMWPVFTFLTSNGPPLSHSAFVNTCLPFINFHISIQKLLLMISNRISCFLRN